MIYDDTNSHQCDEAMLESLASSQRAIKIHADDDDYADQS